MLSKDFPIKPLLQRYDSKVSAPSQFSGDNESKDNVQFHPEIDDLPNLSPRTSIYLR